MATVASSSDQAAELLQNLSLDSETKTAKTNEYVNQGHYGDSGPLVYPQGYGYPPYGIYSPAGDGQLQDLQQYLYPSSYYQPYAPNHATAPQSGGSAPITADQMSLSVETNKGSLATVANGPGVNANNGSKPLKQSYQYPYLDPNNSHRRGSTYYDGIHSPVGWLDSSLYSGGQSKHATNAGFSSSLSHTNNFLSGRNQNHRPHQHLTNLHHTRPTSGYGEGFDYMNQMYPNNMIYSHYGNTYRAGSGYGSFGYDSWISGRGWYAVDGKFKQRGRGNVASGSGKENLDGLNELNKGPRAKGFKNQEGFDPVTLAVKGQDLTSTESNIEDKFPLTPDREKYSGEDFPIENYSDAKFFVIKSYSEDDVHKSVKYNMWTSTPNGNKKLDAAYHEAKEKSADCHVFLLFSVNASGQFVGVAEMVGPVDFDKTVEYWQQDKWTGCFPLNWHIIKDVPNSSLRHITLENNENKPVTNSRDTQEVNFEQGIQILKIFRSHSSKRCILDDFGFYESRERIMQQKKVKQQPVTETGKQFPFIDYAQIIELDKKPRDIAIDDKDVTVGKAIGQQSSDEALIKDKVVPTAEAVDETNEVVKKLDEGGSAAAVEDTTKGVKTVILSEKKSASNGVASAC